MPKAKPEARKTLPGREALQRRSRLLKLVAKLPEATATAHGTHLSLEVRGRRFGWYLEDHHGDGRQALHCKAGSGVAELLAANAPEMFHVPKYLGHRGWIGLWLDIPHVDWSNVETALTEAYCKTAPKSLMVQ